MKLKWIAVLAVAASALFAGTAFAEDNVFTDVDFSTEQGAAIEKMYSVGYLKGYNDGSFKPDATITRAELTRVFNQVFQYELNEEKASTMETFSDVEEEAWYYDDVMIAQSNGYINGFNDGTFRPQDNFTRQQTCVVLALAAGIQNASTDITINDEVSPWALTYVKAAIGDGAFELEENDTFRATANITRGEVCEALAKYVVIESEVVTDETGEAVTNEEGETETTTSVTVKSSSGSSGGGGGSSSGGSSSGSSSSGSSTATTDAETETTTVDSGSSNADNSTTEAETETTTEASVITLTDAEAAALSSIISDTKNKLMYMVKTSEEKEVVQYILDALQSYQADNNYDVSTAIAEAKGMYNALSSEEKDDFYSCLLASYDLSEVSMLMDVFSAFF